MKTHTQPKPKCTCADDVFDISPHCKVHAQPTAAAQHSPLPWKTDGEIVWFFDPVNQDEPAVAALQPMNASWTSPEEASANAAFIVEACNNYANIQADRDNAKAELERVKAERDALLAALKETTDALYNETAGKDDSPWIASVKVKAVNTYADCRPSAAITNAEKP